MGGGGGVKLPLQPSTITIKPTNTTRHTSAVTALIMLIGSIYGYLHPLLF
jgi:hypothetical protein